jgi:hypothetical protein
MGCDVVCPSVGVVTERDGGSCPVVEIDMMLV